ncbi:hypothetical protein QL285_003015 [Trifolium repens]|nr:hypothetical protein QL285_003015 [Trifolium repens]
MAGNGNDSTGENHLHANGAPNNQEDGRFTAVTPSRRRDRSVTRSRSPRRESPRRHRRSPSPRRNTVVHVRAEAGRTRRHRSQVRSPERFRRHRTPESDEDRYLGPLSERVMRVPLPLGLEKLPAMDTYDGSTDPDDHLENIEAVLEWRRVRGAVKCKIFSTTLRKGALTWYKGLPPQSIDSWTELCRKFTAHFTDLIVTFGEDEATKSINVQFLVVECPSLYNCIIERTTLADLFAVSSTIHLKMKYYTVDGKVATLNGDIAAARRCFDVAAKNMNTLATPKKMKTEHKMHAVNTVGGKDIVELDARITKKERREEKKEMQKELKEIFRPIPDGEFEIIPLGEDPSKGIKIGADLPDLVKRQLEACLKENAELFAWSAAEMPGIDPKVACHQLTIDPKARAVAQRRRKQSPEKAKAAEKAVKDLLEANFISESKYTTWLSNVVLVEKSNGKWRMCVDYTDLNRACPKDAYPLPSIDKLVDNLSRFKLLSFMDAYSGYNQIKMAEIDKKKTAFMTESGNY